MARRPSRARAPLNGAVSRRGASVRGASACGAAELGARHDLVGLARRAADDQHAQAFRSRVDLAPRRRPDPHERLLVELDSLSFDIYLSGAAGGHEDLLLPALRVIVLG